MVLPCLSEIVRVGGGDVARDDLVRDRHLFADAPGKPRDLGRVPAQIGALVLDQAHEHVHHLENFVEGEADARVRPSATLNRDRRRSNGDDGGCRLGVLAHGLAVDGSRADLRDAAGEGRLRGLRTRARALARGLSYVGEALAPRDRVVTVKRALRLELEPRERRQVPTVRSRNRRANGPRARDVRLDLTRLRHSLRVAERFGVARVGRHQHQRARLRIEHHGEDAERLGRLSRDHPERRLVDGRLRELVRRDELRLKVRREHLQEDRLGEETEVDHRLFDAHSILRGVGEGLVELIR